MKLSAAFSILLDLRLAIQAAFGPTCLQVLWTPSLILRPHVISRFFMAKVWAAFVAGVDEGGRDVKQGLITPYAQGVVLDIGAGHGHTVNYLDRTRVSKYIALEPNVLMHPHIRGAAHKAGYNESDGTLLILACGAEDTASISSSVHGPIDTLISVLTLCTIPSPEASLTSLVRDVMGPGGQVLFYEHVESPRKDVAWWQKFWTPVWTVAFDGCRLDRPTHLWIGSIKDEEGEGIWAERRVWGKEGESEENLFWHQVGRFVKR